MKRILVPVDFSEYSFAAANTAVTLAAKAGAEIYFLHIHPVSETRRVMWSEPSAKEEEVKHVGEVRASLTALVRKAEQKGVKARIELALGDTQTWIENYLKPFDIDLVVMGSRGTSKSRKAVFGSITLEFIRHATVPVLIIKKAADEFDVRRILFASDFEKDLVKPFKTVFELASVWNSHVDLLYVCTPYHFVSTRQITASMKRFMHQFKGVVYTPHVYNATTEEGGIDEFAKDHNVDMIVMTTEGRTGILRLLKPSIAEGLIKRESKPLLIVNIKSKPPARV